MNDDYVRQVLSWLRSALPVRPEVLDTAWSGRPRLPAIPPRGTGPGDAVARLLAFPQQGEEPGDAGARLPHLPPRQIRLDGVGARPLVVPPQGQEPDGRGARTPVVPVRRERPKAAWDASAPLIPAPRLPGSRRRDRER